MLEKLPNIALSLNAVNLDWMPTVRYVGIILDKKLTLAEHIKITIERVNQYIKILCKLIKRRSKLCKHQK